VDTQNWKKKSEFSGSGTILDSQDWNQFRILWIFLGPLMDPLEWQQFWIFGLKTILNPLDWEYFWILRNGNNSGSSGLRPILDSQDWKQF